MRKALALFVGAVLALAVGCGPGPSPEPPEAGVGDAPLPQDVGCRSYMDRLLWEAASLQALGKHQACAALRALARNGRDDTWEEEWRVYILCRMLFTGRPGGEFRRPPLGETEFPGDTVYEDWPLEPIELVDGIPFLVSGGYERMGEALRPLDYVEYCIANCDWSPVQYLPRSRAEKARALAKLLASPKWRRPLDQREVEILSDQVRERKQQ